MNFAAPSKFTSVAEMAGGDGERTDYLSLVISSSLTSFGAQKRFPASTTVGELKVW